MLIRRSLAEMALCWLTDWLALSWTNWKGCLRRRRRQVQIDLDKEREHKASSPFQLFSRGLPSSWWWWCAAKLVVRCEREWWIGIAFMLAIALPSFLDTFTRSPFAVLPKTNGRPHNKHTGAIRIGQRRPYKWSQSHFLLAKGRAVVN